MPAPKREDETQTGYALRVLRAEHRHGALTEAVAALRAIASARQPPTWGANESLAWKEAANYVEDMAKAALDD